MCAQTSAASRNKPKPVSNEELLNFREILGKYLYHWPLYILLLIICGGAGFVYSKLVKPGYEVKASIVLTDDRDNKTSHKDVLDQLEVTDAPQVVENEIQILKSRNLISRVVYDLKLYINYSRESKLVKKEDLYKKSPVEFELINGQLIGDHKFEVVIKDTSTFLLKGAFDKAKLFHFSNTLSNSFGTWKLNPTKDIKDYIGSTINITVSDPNAVANGFQGAISVTLLDKQASTIELSYTDQLPQRGKDVVNDVIYRYNEENMNAKNLLTQNTLDFIDKRLASLKGELSTAENDVQSYRSSRGINDISKQSDSYLQNTQVNDREMQDVDIQLSTVQAIESYVNSPGRSSVPSTAGITDQGLSSLVQKLVDLQQERERMLANTPESNPIFDPINSQIKAARSAIKENIASTKSTLLAKKRQLQSYGNKAQTQIRDVPKQEQELVSLMRAQQLKETLYTYLQQKREEVALSYASTQIDARTVDTAYVVPPKGSKKMIPLAAGLALGLFIPTGLILGRHTFRNRISTNKDITRAVSIPILSELTFEKSKNPIVVHDRGKFALAEEFRTLRTKLHYLHEKTDKGRVTLLTSSIATEGKSFVATNLAVALAASGRKTIILEMDLRKPRVTAVLDIQKDHVGISNYLIGEATETRIIQKSELYPNLDVMGSGTIDTNPSELLEQESTTKLFEWLREHYDDIIVDTPPVSIVTDAIILSRLVDVTLYVVRQGYTPKTILPFMKNLEEEQHFPKLNIVFNGIEKGRYGYSGYTSYGYGDYIESKEARKKYSRGIFSDFFKRF
ncbi:GumC family protein [Mucilaginibacter ginsenosidivorans]|uniref:non-specific protein-tyrosine kinase n=1 Tax=Mucilaginibacter ginsenosidivorans TaxID=398053 RepID=A0A5B8V0M7_9SPHI|nr:polysaccharide biosynthesis tyrosine autokinase [Mucilaginibacter ginsenosidivorans]QEC64363.1 polysaccharide biosynthesis tyrosine autokinase [Mucilaginibacter ginsenosidivorans]